MSGNVPIFLGGGRGEVTENCGRWRSGPGPDLSRVIAGRDDVYPSLIFFFCRYVFYLLEFSLSFLSVMVDDDKESYRASSVLSDPNRLPAPIFGVSHAKKGVLPSLRRREIIGERRRKGIV